MFMLFPLKDTYQIFGISPVSPVSMSKEENIGIYFLRAKFWIMVISRVLLINIYFPEATLMLLKEINIKLS